MLGRTAVIFLFVVLSACGGGGSGGPGSAEFETGSGDVFSLDAQYGQQYLEVLNMREGISNSLPETGSVSYAGLARGSMDYYDPRLAQLLLWGKAELDVNFATSTVDGQLDAFVGTYTNQRNGPVFFDGGIRIDDGVLDGSTFEFGYSGELTSGENSVSVSGTGGEGRLRGEGGSGAIGGFIVGSGFDGNGSVNESGVSQGRIYFAVRCQDAGCEQPVSPPDAK